MTGNIITELLLEFERKLDVQKQSFFVPGRKTAQSQLVYFNIKIDLQILLNENINSWKEETDIPQVSSMNR